MISLGMNIGALRRVGRTLPLRVPGRVRPYFLHVGRALVVAFLAMQDSVAQRLSEFETPLPMPEHSTLLIGFLGGLERWDDPHRGVRKVALASRRYSAHPVFAETLENRHLATAFSLVVRAIDKNGNGRLEPDERRSARIIIFGQSLGGAATVRLAQRLQEEGVPVLLTVQVDSVGWSDGVIPANVQAAANFYQRGPLTIKGRSAIHALDRSCTRIIGNFAFSYPLWSYDPHDRENASLARLILGGGHAKMETDSGLWARVQQLIDSAISGLFQSR